MTTDSDFDLTQWAKAVGIVHPADRPWSFAEPPAEVAQLEPGAICPVSPKDHPVFSVRRHPCNNGTAWLWIGQCPRCQAVVWSFARKEIPRAQTYPAVDESFARLHHAGWSIGDTQLLTGSGALWLVCGSNGENLIEARGSYAV